MIGYFSQIGSCFTRKQTMVLMLLIDILAAFSFFCCDVYLAMMMDVSGAIVLHSVFRYLCPLFRFRVFLQLQANCA